MKKGPVLATAPVKSLVETQPTISKLDKEAQRKETARRRDLSRPIRKDIEKAETKISRLQTQLAEIENQLADTALYDAARKDDLLKCMNQQTELKTSLAQVEELMLELMMQLEELESSFE